MGIFGNMGRAMGMGMGQQRPQQGGVGQMGGGYGKPQQQMQQGPQMGGGIGPSMGGMRMGQMGRQMPGMRMGQQRQMNMGGGWGNKGKSDNLQGGLNDKYKPPVGIAPMNPQQREQWNQQWQDNQANNRSQIGDSYGSANPGPGGMTGEALYDYQQQQQLGGGRRFGKMKPNFQPRQDMYEPQVGMSNTRIPDQQQNIQQMMQQMVGGGGGIGRMFGQSMRGRGGFGGGIGPSFMQQQQPAMQQEEPQY